MREKISDFTEKLLRDPPEERRSRVHVLGFAPAKYVNASKFGGVNSYRAKITRDLIPYIHISSMIRAYGSITTLDSHPDAEIHDHGIRSPTFTRSIIDDVSDFYQQYGRK